MAATNSQGNAPGGHGGSQVSGATSTNTGSTKASDKQRTADIAETQRRANVARAQQAATKARVKAAARRHIGPLK